jgi:F-box protein 9
MIHLFREIVEMTYTPPQIPDVAFLSELARYYMFDYRRLYIENPRVRTDGVYIAFCHYVYVLSSLHPSHHPSMLS